MDEEDNDCEDCIFNALCTAFEKDRDNRLGECDAYVSLYDNEFEYSWEKYTDTLFDYVEDGEHLMSESNLHQQQLLNKIVNKSQNPILNTS